MRLDEIVVALKNNNIISIEYLELDILLRDKIIAILFRNFVP